MPFPLAHPAAILPLRRFCPALLNFPALVAGSLAPDLGYLFKETRLEDSSHEALGGMAFGVISGLLMMAGWYSLGPILIRQLSRIGALRTWDPYSINSLEQAVLPKMDRPLGSAAALILSLLIGIWTHLLLDSITHADGWLVGHSQLLHQTIAIVDQRTVRVCHLLWYAGSYLGMAWLVLAFREWQEGNRSSNASQSGKSHAAEALLIPFLVLPIELMHHLVRSRAGLVLVFVLGPALIACFMLGIGRQGNIKAEGQEVDGDF